MVICGMLGNVLCSVLIVLRLCGWCNGVRGVSVCSLFSMLLLMIIGLVYCVLLCMM